MILHPVKDYIVTTFVPLYEAVHVKLCNCPRLENDGGHTIRDRCQSISQSIVELYIKTLTLAITCGGGPEDPCGLFL